MGKWNDTAVVAEQAGDKAGKRIQVSRVPVTRGQLKPVAVLHQLVLERVNKGPAHLCILNMCLHM